MKTFLSICLMLALGAAPCRLRADEAPAPDLPKAGDIKDAPQVDPNSKADVEVPEGEPEAKKESVKAVTEKPGHFRWGNFLLGALGGAALISAGGILAGGAADPQGGLDGSKIGVLAGAGALGGGILSVLLGATSPLPATPPDMSRSRGPMLVMAFRF